jgi:hypothetical protein
MLLRRLLAALAGSLLAITLFSLLILVQPHDVSAAGIDAAPPLPVRAHRAEVDLAAVSRQAATFRVPEFPELHPPPPQNWLLSDDGTLNTYVGIYGDCSGRQQLTYASAAIDTCLGGRTYFIGHNPGVFTPLMRMDAGSELTYYDAARTAHRLRIVGVRRWYRFDGAPPLLRADVAYQFQTCITLDGTWDRILDAVEV